MIVKLVLWLLMLVSYILLTAMVKQNADSESDKYIMYGLMAGVAFFTTAYSIVRMKELK